MKNKYSSTLESNNSAYELQDRDFNEKVTLSSVSVQNLSLFYRNKPAFKNISLKIKSGCITALVGPSGCGKSSFLLSLNRLTDLIPGCEVEGKIEVDGVDVLSDVNDIALLRKKVGLIFQKPNPFPLSVLKNIELPLREHGVRDKNERMQIMENVLRDTGLWNEVKDRLHSSALSLSGGQQQRLCIARAIALEPDILLLDEPCSSLDPLSGGVVEDLITDLKDRFTILIVTHNLSQAKRISDYCALFWLLNGSGGLVEYASTQQFFENPEKKLTSAYVNGMRG